MSRRNLAFDARGGMEQALKMHRPSLFARGRIFKLRSKNEPRGRFVFKNKTVFMIALLLSVMETFNFQRGFTNTRKYQGAAFMIPLCVLFVFLGLPLMLSQIFLGLYGGVGIIKLWRLAPIGYGIGFSMLIVSLLRVIGKARLCSVSLLRVVFSMASKLPWADCDFVHDDTPCLSTGQTNFTEYMSEKKCCKTALDTFSICPTKDRLIVPFPSFAWHQQEFFDFNYSIEDNGIGKLNGYLAASVVVVWALIFLTLYQEIRILNKVLVPLGALISLLYVVILVIVFLCGGDKSLKGIQFFFEMKPEAFKLSQLWIDCTEKAMESLHLICGSYIIYSSYAPKDTNVISIAVLVGFVKAVVSIFVMLLYSALGGVVASLLQVPPACIQNVGWESTNAIPAEFFASLSYPQAWTILYFFFIFMIDFAYMVLLLFAVVESVLDVRPKLREYYMYIILGLCVFCVLAALPLATRGGPSVNHFLQEVLMSAGNVALACYAVVVMWLYGVVRLSDDLYFFSGKPPSKFWTYMWYLSPVTFLLFLLPLSYYVLVKIDNLHTWLDPFFIGVYLLVILPIPAVAIYQCTVYFKTTHFFTVFLPAREWGPTDTEEKRRRQHFNPRKIVRFRIDGPLKHRPAGLLSRKHLKLENDRLEAHRKIFLEFIKAKEEEAWALKGRPRDSESETSVTGEKRKTY